VLRHLALTTAYSDGDEFVTTNTLEAWPTPSKPPLLLDQVRAIGAARRATTPPDKQFRMNGADAIRQDVLDIADELENQ
jgi:hypothetical protein